MGEGAGALVVEDCFHSSKSTNTSTTNSWLYTNN
jgi:hypothetical protein